MVKMKREKERREYIGMKKIPKILDSKRRLVPRLDLSTHMHILYFKEIE